MTARTSAFPSLAALCIASTAFLLACSPSTTPAADAAMETAVTVDASPDVNVLSPDAAPDVPLDVPPDVPAPDAGFVVGPHGDGTQVPDQGGMRYAHPQLVLISYADDPNRDGLEAHGRWLVTSNWLTTVGAEYALGTGTVLGTVHRTDNAPDVITDTQIQALLNAGINDHSLPRSADGTFDNVIYMIYFPSHTTVTEGSGARLQRSCEAFGGYHGEARNAGTSFAYAVIPTCMARTPELTDAESQQLVVTHEVFEAMTDPLAQSRPGLAFDLNSGSPWLLVGPELGDLCALRVGPSGYVREGTFLATRVWSNLAAIANDRDPCVPASPTVPYYALSITPDQLQPIAAGESVTFDVQAWSTAPVAAWRVVAQAAGGGFTPQLSLSATTMNNGDHATLTVTAPATAPANSYSLIYVETARSMTEYTAYPVVVLVQ